ncbi:hypothetical protein BpHYR1_049715 [Brachionus plicatilis]|uniref:Uncharacterized protein n=1 Tax=Brachionus plicatilis TaxID=10195 RepID=A0A3M7RP69_BRAPC|nr:hypothetical protein BpHYR1_049715 [Brachionus plicatilis]
MKIKQLNYYSTINKTQYFSSTLVDLVDSQHYYLCHYGENSLLYADAEFKKLRKYQARASKKVFIGDSGCDVRVMV